MADVTLNITAGFYESSALPLAAQNCVNFYINAPQSVGLAQETLFGTDGIEQVGRSGDLDYNRGGIAFQEKPYFVNGNALYRLNRIVAEDSSVSYELESIGEIEGTGRVSMAINSTQLCILVPGGKGYIFTTDPDDTLEEITDEDFRANGNPLHVVYVDGYFLFTTDDDRFIISAINDGKSYNALDFGSAEVDPDAIVAPFVWRNQVFISGRSTTEVFQNQPNGADFPFVRAGLFFEKGVIAPFSLVKASGMFAFVGSGKNETPAIWAYGGGGEAQKLSTNAIDNALFGVNPEDIFAWSYADRGSYFIGFSTPADTFVFDTATGKWHERKSQFRDAKGNLKLGRYRPNCFVQAYGELFVGDMHDGRIGVLSSVLYSEYGEDILREVTTPHYQNSLQSMFINSVELVVDAGNGDGQIGLQLSHDGGTEFTDPRFRGMGKAGDYTRRLIWRRLGRISRLVCFRFTLTDRVKPVLLLAKASMEGGLK